MSDIVNSPSHYTQGKIEVLDFIIDQKMDYLIKEMERFEADTQRRLENLEDKVYKK